eukprot:CAMPEP_0183537954 /NCGR_PEP_ID=MMETSP0371-20130417/29263_1 /TAXON_ID=268820 /ORGANISM="Peridinium aciculiferum, Strain PAER-2" /LENGTH=84 /DNA_ID=CAMNT_0025738727 /DNA_START=149 /DNA_END=403 /DNA_ORIENTATION=-
MGNAGIVVKGIDGLVLEGGVNDALGGLLHHDLGSYLQSAEQAVEILRQGRLDLELVMWNPRVGELQSPSMQGRSFYQLPASIAS